MFETVPNIPIQKINSEILSKNEVELFIKREDLIHPEISGNKWRKLKYNITHAKKNGNSVIATFGGAFSNHIAATAAAGELASIPTHGFIRGEKVLPLNSTLKLAADHGMTFTFLSREDYKKKSDPIFLNALISDLENPFVIPEGGANELGVKGCEEIVKDVEDYDVIVTACGTGGTLAGIINGMNSEQMAIGFPVLKGGGFLEGDVKRFLKTDQASWRLELNYHFGGYARKTPELIQFIRSFWIGHQIKLDPIYTGKAMFGLMDLIKRGEFSKKKILFVHTGGLQGVSGFEGRYGLSLFDPS